MSRLLKESIVASLVLIVMSVAGLFTAVNLSRPSLDWWTTTETTTNVADTRSAQGRCKAKKGITTTTEFYNAPKGRPRKPVSWEISCRIR